MKLFIIPLLALGLITGNTAETLTISQQNRSFSPVDVTLAAGATLRIENDDRFVHHVKTVDSDMDVDSGVQRPGEWLEIQFEKQGVYELRCDIHPKMKLTVTVE
ncbi:MAG: cupredoxin domain-containing protein [Pseudomonadota bacterium]